MTVGHFCFDAPQPCNSLPPSVHNINLLQQPSGQDSDGQRDLLLEQRKQMEKRGEVIVVKDLDETIAVLENFRQSQNFFAEPVLATWTVIQKSPSDIAEPKIYLCHLYST